jgi:hypothetical protein
MMRSTHFLTVVVFLLLGVIGCRAEEKRFDSTFAVTPGGKLVVETDVGSVKVVGGAGTEVVVEAVVRGKEREVNEFTVTADQRENVVEVHGRWSSKAKSWRSHKIDVSFVIRVPREFNVDVGTSGGSVRLESLTGTVTGKTSGGSVRAEDINGPLVCETSGGSIKVERIAGKTTLETSGGRVTANAVAGDIDAETSGGGLSLTGIEGEVRAETSGGSITIELVGENRGVYASTSGGSIDISLPPDVRATLDASTSGGSVSCDLPVTTQGRMDPTSLHGTLNGGGNPIHASTSGGSVRIRAK